VVRFKLDKCRIKLSLAKWNRLPKSARRNLVCGRRAEKDEVARYGQMLCRLITHALGEEPRRLIAAPDLAWECRETPEEIVNAALRFGVRALSSEQWRRLSALLRYALPKVSRPDGDNQNLIPALREFGFVTDRLTPILVARVP